MKKSLFTLLFIIFIIMYTALTSVLLIIHVFSIPFSASVVEGEFFGAYTRKCATITEYLQKNIS